MVPHAVVGTGHGTQTVGFKDAVRMRKPNSLR